ncbi:hypothetical protein QJQ45_023033 [Haematococcus lacustris]|nr:hypothetical protein QJQ45_023033 [Haematococcus lacustris]
MHRAMRLQIYRLDAACKVLALGLQLLSVPSAAAKLEQAHRPPSVNPADMGKAKPAKHTAAEIKAKEKAALTNMGGGKLGLSDRLGGKAGHAKYMCHICKTAAPSITSMQATLGASLPFFCPTKLMPACLPKPLLLRKVCAALLSGWLAACPLAREAAAWYPSVSSWSPSY